jgi:Ca-activated chloride channel family protein
VIFEQPVYIALGPLALLTAFLLTRFFKPYILAARPLGAPGKPAFRPPDNMRWFTGALRAAEGTAVLLLFIAAAGPGRLSPETVWLNRGADILFVLDVSPSMAALDMNFKSRFDAARNLIRDFAARRPSDAIGLVAVGDEAALLVPPTTDRRTLGERLEALRIGELGDGTALGLGLAIAARHLGEEASGGATRRAAVLITDGENNSGAVNPETAAALFPKSGVSFWVIGAGSSGEVPFSYVDPATGTRRSGYLLSKYDPQALESLALKGGGTWIRAADADGFLTAFARLDEGEQVARREASLRRVEPVHQGFIIVALVLLCLAWFTRRAVLGAPV